MKETTFNKETKVWSGPKVHPIYNSDQNLGQLIVKVLELTPDAVTQISADTGVSVTCGEMRDRILKIAAHLSGLGLKQGDVIGIVAANTENLAPLVFACFLMGYPVNPLATIMVESDIVHMYSKTKPKVIFCDGNNVNIVQNAVDKLKSEPEIYTIMEKVDGYGCVTNVLKTAKTKTTPNPDIDPNSPAMILGSSGSTGLPKAILKSHKNLILECFEASEFKIDSQKVILQSASIYAYSGFFLVMISTLYMYKRIIAAQRFDRDLMIEVINKYKVTHLCTPPFLITYLLQKENLQPLPSVRCWMIGGASVTKIMCEKFEPFIPNGKIFVIYACTEQGLLTLSSNTNKYGSAGTAARNSCMKVKRPIGRFLMSI
jgi:4-coumarate--CoA ligase